MYFKMIHDGYILGVGIGSQGTRIDESEYEMLTDTIHNAPQKDGYVYRLKEDLTWEEQEVIPEGDEPTSDEILNIILGGDNA